MQKMQQTIVTIRDDANLDFNMNPLKFLNIITSNKQLLYMLLTALATFCYEAIYISY
jgi:hypothetical protein